MKTKTLFVQVQLPNKDVVFVLTNAPSDGDEQIQAIQPDVPLHTHFRRIHATEANEFLSFFNSDEAANEGEKAADIREIAQRFDKTFVEQDFAEGIVAVRSQWKRRKQLCFQPGGSRAKIRDPPP